MQFDAALRREDGVGPVYSEHRHTARGVWHLVLDASRFHAYVAVVMPEAAVRFDWDDENRLKAGPYVPTPDQVVFVLGTAPCCVPCTKLAIARFERPYNLFEFNCRTVSFLLLTRVASFPPRDVFALFKKHATLCGLDRRACMSATEMRHLFDWIVAQDDTEEAWCRLF